MKKIILFGSGYLGKKYYKYLQRENFEVAFFCDNNTSKQGELYDGVKICSPDRLKEIDDEKIILITCEKYAEIEKQLDDMGIDSHYSYLEYSCFVNCLKNKTKIEDTYNESCELKKYDSIFASNTGKYRGTMLMVDGSIPAYDNNCGARVIMQYIEIFLKLNMRIIFIPADFEYSLKYTEKLQQLGVEVIYGREWKENYETLLDRYLKYIDYAFLNRPESAKKFIDIIKKNKNIKISYWGCDLHYLRLQRQYEITKDKALLPKIEQMKSLEYELIEKADFCGYPSSDEIKYLQEDGIENVEIYPLYYFKSREIKQRRSNNKNLLFVGGFDHYPNEDGIVWFINEIKPIIEKRGFKDKVYIVGSNVTEKVKALASENVIVTGYVTDEKLSQLYDTCRISIAPLRIGAGVKGKIIEAMYEGLPVVTTSIGAEGIAAEEAGILVCDDKEDFADKLMKVYNSEEMLNEISIKEQRYIEKYYGEEKLEKLFLGQIESIKLV